MVRYADDFVLMGKAITEKAMKKLTKSLPPLPTISGLHVYYYMCALLVQNIWSPFFYFFWQILNDLKILGIYLFFRGK